MTRAQRATRTLTKLRSAAAMWLMLRTVKRRISRRAKPT